MAIMTDLTPEQIASAVTKTVEDRLKEKIVADLRTLLNAELEKLIIACAEQVTKNIQAAVHGQFDYTNNKAEFKLLIDGIPHVVRGVKDLTV